MLVSFLPDVRWACGFTGSNGLLLVTPGAAHLVTDGRYTEQARREVAGAEVLIAPANPLAFAAESGLLKEVKAVLYQADHTTVVSFNTLQQHIPDVTWIGAEELLSRDVAVKSPGEVEAIQRAQRVTEEVFSHILTVIRPGMTEREVAAEITFQHLRRGAEKMSFDPIVASGPQGALPHARPTDRRIEQGDMIVLDFGCFVDGYASDMTRTLAIGEPGPEARAVYSVVLEAQLEALRAAQGGMLSPDLDREARAVIERNDLGDYFTHGLGHGVGLQIHEWPRVSRAVDYPLPLGAVVTIEPGVYLPGCFGVRIEDLIVLEEGGCRNLTSASKELLVL